MNVTWLKELQAVVFDHKVSNYWGVPRALEYLNNAQWTNTHRDPSKQTVKPIDPLIYQSIELPTHFCRYVFVVC